MHKTPPGGSIASSRSIKDRLSEELLSESALFWYRITGQALHVTNAIRYYHWAIWRPVHNYDIQRKQVDLLLFYGHSISMKPKAKFARPKMELLHCLTLCTSNKLEVGPIRFLRQGGEPTSSSLTFKKNIYLDQMIK